MKRVSWIVRTVWCWGRTFAVCCATISGAYEKGWAHPPEHTYLLHSCQDMDQEARRFQHVWGNPHAEVFVVVYSSLSCGLCADFFMNTLPRLQEACRQTPRLCVIIRDYPTDGLSLRASLLLWGDQQPHAKLLHALHAQHTALLQKAPMGKEVMEQTLQDIAIQCGLSTHQIAAALKNTDLAKQIVARREKERMGAGIHFVPTLFVVNIRNKTIERLDHNPQPGFASLFQALKRQLACSFVSE